MAGNIQVLRADPKGGPIAKNHALGPKGRHRGTGNEGSYGHTGKGDKGKFSCYSIGIGVV
jgi:hypothetical protein